VVRPSSLHVHDILGGSYMPAYLSPKHE